MHTAALLPDTAAMPAAATSRESSDEALMAAIAAGDRRAMHPLYARHSARVYRFILRMTGREALAEDLTHEVFLDVWRGAGRFQARAQVSTWLLAIAHNKAVDALRKREDAPLNEEGLAREEDPADGPDAIVERNERAALLRRCLARLSPAHRQIVDLVYYHERSVEEAAAVLGIPRATVKTRMFYARRRLAVLMREYEAEGRALQ